MVLVRHGGEGLSKRILGTGVGSSMADTAPITQYVPKAIMSRPGKAPSAAAGKSKRAAVPFKRPDPAQLANLLRMFAKPPSR